MGMLDGRVAIVTGAGRGLGRQHALELARHGATVVVNDLGVGLHGDQGAPGPADDVVTEITAAGGTAHADSSSVTDFAATEALVNSVVERYGHLDAVVNNAGIVRDRMITTMSEEDFDAVVSVHLKGTWNLTRHACAHWREKAKTAGKVAGRIVNTTSGAGLFGNIGQSNYGPAKAAIASLTMIVAMEMDRYGVTANAVSPLARTRMTAGIMSDEQPDGTWDLYDPANASPVVAWLCSPESSWLTGMVLRITGDTVEPMRPWDIDAAHSYRGRPGQPVDATKLDSGLRKSFGLFPAGLPASALRD